MASKVEICSQALLLIGDNSISALTEDSDRAMLCTNLYTPVKQATLRAHPWNCAIKRVELAPVAEAPAYGYSYAFNLPPDCLRILSIGDYNNTDYKVEGRQVLYDDNVLPLRYVFDNPDESTFDALLTEAITYALAARLAYPITKSTSLMQAMQQTYADVLSRARGVDAQEDTPEEFGNFPLLEVRY